MRGITVVVFGLLAAPLAAQDLDFNIGATAACLDAAATTPEARACIGLSANACMDATPMGSSTIGMGGCIDRELTWWDARLNAQYADLRTRERARDAGDGGNRAEALRDMQRAWIAWRDATCDYERAQWGGGTGGGPATAACLMRLTGEQALYLEAMAMEY